MPDRRRLIELGTGMFARMAVAIAPSAKTAAAFAPFEPAAEICVLPTPVAAGAVRPARSSGSVVLATEHVAAALLRMLEDDALRARVSRAGAAAVAAYPPEVFLDRLVAIYDRVR